MRKRIILFVIPVIALLIMATALVFSVATSSFAAGVSTTSHTTISTPAATKTTTGGGIKPNFNYNY